MEPQDVEMIADYKFEGRSSGMGIRGGKPEILRQLGCSEGMEEKSKPARFKNRSMRHPQLAQRPRACHPPIRKLRLGGRADALLIIGCALRTRYRQTATAENRTGELLVERGPNYQNDDGH